MQTIHQNIKYHQFSLSTNKSIDPYDFQGQIFNLSHISLILIDKHANKNQSL